jgi:amino acid transporter
MKIYKFVGWVVLVGVLSFLFWQSIYSWLNGTEVLSYSNYHVISVIYIILFMAIMGLGFALFDFYWQALLGLIFAALGFLLGANFTVINLVAALVIVFLGWYQRTAVRHAVNQSIKLRSRAIIGSGLSALVVSTALGVAVIAYQSDVLTSLTKQERIPSASESFIKSMIDKLINENVKVDTSNIRKNVVESAPSAVENELGPLFGPLIKIVGDDYIKQIAGRSISQNLPNDETLKKNIINDATRSVMNSVNSTLRPYFRYAKIIGAVSLFLILISLSWIFYWLAILVGMVLLIILRLTRFIKVEEVDIKAERMMI